MPLANTPPGPLSGSMKRTAAPAMGRRFSSSTWTMGFAGRALPDVVDGALALDDHDVELGGRRRLLRGAGEPSADSRAGRTGAGKAGRTSMRLEYLAWQLLVLTHLLWAKAGNLKVFFRLALTGMLETQGGLRCTSRKPGSPGPSSWRC